MEEAWSPQMLPQWREGYSSQRLHCQELYLFLLPPNPPWNWCEAIQENKCALRNSFSASPPSAFCFDSLPDPFHFHLRGKSLSATRVARFQTERWPRSGRSQRRSHFTMWHFFKSESCLNGDGSGTQHKLEVKIKHVSIIIRCHRGTEYARPKFALIWRFGEHTMTTVGREVAI